MPGRAWCSDTTRSILIIRRPPRLQKAFVADYMDRYKEAPHWEADRAYFSALATYKAGVEAAQKGGEQVADAGAGGRKRCPGPGGRKPRRQGPLPQGTRLPNRVFYQGPVHQTPTNTIFPDAGVDRHFPRLNSCRSRGPRILGVDQERQDAGLRHDPSLWTSSSAGTFPTPAVAVSGSRRACSWCSASRRSSIWACGSFYGPGCVFRRIHRGRHHDSSSAWPPLLFFLFRASS